MTSAPAVDPALIAACELVDLDPSDVRPLREHGSAVYLLPRHEVFAKVNHRSDDRSRARTAVTVARWLVEECSFPATAPTAVNQPVDLDNLGATVTFWRHYPQDGKPQPPSAPLGSLLSKLHHLGDPPVQLEPYPPLHSLGETVKESTWLSSSDQAWLLDRREDLIRQYAELDSPLGNGMIHGDAYPGNTLWGPAEQVLMADWDEVAYGPRELDLANTFQGGVRFGRGSRELQDFVDAYGHDPRQWDGFAVLVSMRDLHTLASYIRLADRGDENVRRELSHRIGTLQSGDKTARWNARQ
ncbi:phosphotransferase [Lentzea tibetensis]|uniref:Phosphotransferase n=1 Tax=Lentzea tibetensis TaxID=2591470 RepID=A0A563EUX2_9PSEU|nr:phosphotransferase [Lentzea tibetensis]TWP51480.1 phosphotransferase [Lentzea tibetensis]